MTWPRPDGACVDGLRPENRPGQPAPALPSQRSPAPKGSACPGGGSPRAGRPRIFQRRAAHPVSRAARRVDEGYVPGNRPSGAAGRLCFRGGVRRPGGPDLPVAWRWHPGFPVPARGTRRRSAPSFPPGLRSRRKSGPALKSRARSLSRHVVPWGLCGVVLVPDSSAAASSPVEWRSARRWRLAGSAESLWPSFAHRGPLRDSWAPGVGPGAHAGPTSPCPGRTRENTDGGVWALGCRAALAPWPWGPPPLLRKAALERPCLIAPGLAQICPVYIGPLFASFFT